MSLFKNANEEAYVGGKKHVIDVIKNTGSGDYLIYRQPEEDFNINSKLLVMPGEAAVFVDQGKIVAVFEDGNYKLTTQNYPFISRLTNAFSGGVSRYNCVIYFVRKAVSRELLWGVGDIRVRDKLWNIVQTVGAHGAFKLRVDNPGIFLETIVGNNISYLKQTDVLSYFGEELKGKIKPIFAQFLNEWPGELIGLDAHLEAVSSSIKATIDERLIEYGLKCESFSCSGLEMNAEKYERIDESQISLITSQRLAQADKIAKLMGAEADADVFSLLGENWPILRASGILEKLAENPGAGGVAAAGAGIGMGVVTGSVFTHLADQLFTAKPGKRQVADYPVYYESRRYKQADEKEIGKPSVSEPIINKKTEDKDIAALEKLKEMLDKGLIEKDEYDQKKKEILSRM